MVDPFELHPNDKGKMSGKKSSALSISQIKKVVETQVEKIKKQQTPTWGFNQRHIENFFNDLVHLLEEAAENEDDS